VSVIGIALLLVPIVLAVCSLIFIALFYPLVALLWLAGVAKATGGIWWFYLLCGLLWNGDHLLK
jgi:hypothetical protein